MGSHMKRHLPHATLLADSTFAVDVEKEYQCVRLPGGAKQTNHGWFPRCPQVQGKHFDQKETRTFQIPKRGVVYLFVAFWSLSSIHSGVLTDRVFSGHSNPHRSPASGGAAEIVCGGDNPPVHSCSSSIPRNSRRTFTSVRNVEYGGNPDISLTIPRSFFLATPYETTDGGLPRCTPRCVWIPRPTSKSLPYCVIFG